jgi:hypothetical protein
MIEAEIDCEKDKQKTSDYFAGVGKMFQIPKKLQMIF